MALSTAARRRLEVALAHRATATEIANAIDSGGNPQAAAVAALGATTNMTALAPAATTFTALAVTAASIADSNFTAAIPTEPTKAEIDVGIDTLRDAVETALDLKADNADVETLRGEMETAMDLKADNADVETLRTEAEARLDAVEAKVDAVIAALKTAGLMAT